MNESRAKTGLDALPRRAPAAMPTARVAGLRGRLPFLLLLGFIGSQGYLVPVTDLPGLNWAVWPSLPDVFGVGLLAVVLVSRGRGRLSEFDRGLIKDLLLMEALFTANFLFVTLPNSSTGTGIRFGGFTVILLAKYIAVFWAISHVALNRARIRAIHWAAIVAFVWLNLSTIADRFHIIEIDEFMRHLPADAGKWSVRGMSSTVGPNHGNTSVAILVIGALVVLTSGRKVGWLVEACVLLLGGVGIAISGSRQGIVRLFAFVGAYLVPRPKRLVLVLMVMLPLAGLAYLRLDPRAVAENDAVQDSIERQMVLVTDPVSNEGMSGRPGLWLSVLDTLNDDPVRWIVGYGIGNYAEFGNAAHNMVLQFLQDGGLVFLCLVTALWVRVWRRLWAIRQRAWASVALFIGLLASSMTSGIFYPNLATGWYLGLFFVILHIQAALAAVSPSSARGKVRV